MVVNRQIGFQFGVDCAPFSRLFFEGAKINLHQVNIAARGHKSDPYPFYARLRDDHPVFPLTLPDKRTIWLITRYEDVANVLKDIRFVKNPANVADRFNVTRQPWMPGFARPLIHHMLNQDKQAHARLRGLVNKAFSPSRILQMAPQIHEVAEMLLKRIRGRKRIDLIADFALPFPTIIIAEMLGVPACDRERFIRWTNVIMQISTSKWGMFRSVPSVWAFVRYLRKFIRSRQLAPQEDLVSALVTAEVDGEVLTDDELLSMVFLLLVAGHETTVNLIGNGVLALLKNPRQLQLLRSDFGLMKPAVEELLRFDSPIEMGTERYASEDVTVADVKIPGGALVGCVIASANRDDRQFKYPDKLEIRREPNKHLSFGLGAHYCTGAALARMEGQIAIQMLLQTLPNIQLATSSSHLSWRPGLVTRGLENLPVILGN